MSWSRWLVCLYRLRRHLCDPLCQIVIGCNARNLLVFYLKEGSRRKLIFLPMCGWQTRFCFAVFTRDVKFSGRPCAIFADEDSNVGQRFFIVVRHAGVKGLKFVDTNTTLALVNIMDHVGRDQLEHSVLVPGIECLVIFADKGGGCSSGLRPCVFLAHGAAFLTSSERRFYKFAPFLTSLVACDQIGMLCGTFPGVEGANLPCAGSVVYGNSWPMTQDQKTYVVAALYRFTPLDAYESYRDPLFALCEGKSITGTLLLAKEGINGTIAGSREAIDAVLARLRTLPGCEDLDVKESYSHVSPFVRLKVKLKREIVTMGVEDIDPRTTVGTYVTPENWNDVISDPDTVVVDTRNDYEVAIGTFKGAVNPETESFRQLPGWADANLPEDKNTKIAMFCTGGIRCEKSTALLKQRGYENVFHLQGGILKYLETVPEQQSLWDGECFVFDRRVSVGHELKPGPYQLCATCREPFLSGEGAGGYARHVCEVCDETVDDRTRQRALARQRQIELAYARGDKHLGPRPKLPDDAPKPAKKRAKA